MDVKAFKLGLVEGPPREKLVGRGLVSQKRVLGKGSLRRGCRQPRLEAS